MRRLACLVVLVLAGCSRSAERFGAGPGPVAAPVGSGPVAGPVRSGPAAKYAWARSDGQRIAANPELIEEAQADIAACQAESPPRAAQGVPGEPCMRERGYYVRQVE